MPHPAHEDDGNSMSNPKQKAASREEEIAFQVLEQALGVTIQLADAGSGPRQPDGVWTRPDGVGTQGVVEVTSPPDEELMRKWARAKREGEPQVESGSVALRWGELGQVCSELLEEDWAKANVAKLLAYPAFEHHLFLHARSYRVENYFNRLSDDPATNPPEEIGDLILPDGVTDVWFRGRSKRLGREVLGDWILRVARYNVVAGWCRLTVEISERSLPAPNHDLATDRAPDGWRAPTLRKVSEPSGAD